MLPRLTRLPSVSAASRRTVSSATCPSARSSRSRQDAAVSELHKRLVAPLRAWLESDGTASPDLRAQVLTAAFAGIMEARASNALPAVKAASVPELAAVVRQMLAAAGASKDPGSRQKADGGVTG